MLGRPRYEQNDPGDDKNYLCDDTDRGVDDHAGCRLRAGYAAQMRQRALAMSPPTPATGNSALIDSQDPAIQVTIVTASGRLEAGNSSRQERAAKNQSGTRWIQGYGDQPPTNYQHCVATSPRRCRKSGRRPA